MLTRPIVVLDFETTGLSPDWGARITEVAALRIEGNRIVERYTSLINCGVRVPYEITALTGITQAMVNGAPPVAAVIPELLSFIGSEPVAAHNASFDAKFLRAECGQLGAAMDGQAFICSLKLSRRIYPALPNHRLGTVASHLGVRFSGAAHRAEADAEVTAKVLISMAEHFGERYGMGAVDPGVFARVQQLAKGKVEGYLQGL